MDLPKLTLSMLCYPGTQFATLPASSFRKEAVPAHRLPPTFAAGGAVQVLRPHHAKVVF